MKICVFLGFLLVSSVVSTPLKFDQLGKPARNDTPLSLSSLKLPFLVWTCRKSFQMNTSLYLSQLIALAARKVRGDACT